MHVSKILVAPLAAAILSAAPTARADDHGAGASTHSHVAPEKSQQPVQTVQVAVTKDGFVPATVTVKHGQPIKLIVTRKVERTCATDIVSKDLGVNKALPLDKPVTVNVAAKKPGEYRFACAMDMIAGTLKVE